MPWLPARAAAALTLRSPLSIEFDVQVERLPGSKPSAKIWSEEIGGAIGVRVAVDIEALVAVAGTAGVLVTVAANVGGITVGVRVAVGVAIGADVEVGVAAGTDPAPTQLALPESVKVCPAIGTNCQS